jgi:outer membrane protein assembly factor BamB
MLGSPVIDPQGDIYLGVLLVRAGEEPAGRLVCVGGQTHRVRWEYPARGAVESTPVVASDGTVYFGDNAGFIHAVGRDGQSRWSCNVGAPVRSAGALLTPNRLIFGLDTGILIALACSPQS